MDRVAELKAELVLVLERAAAIKAELALLVLVPKKAAKPRRLTAWERLSEAERERLVLESIQV